MQGVELVDEQAYLLFVQYWVQLGDGDVFGEVVLADEHTVVVLLAQHVVGPEGFHRSEAVPQGEMVQQIVFQVFGKFGGGQAFGSDRREFGQFPPFGFGNFRIRQQQVQDHAAHQKDRQDCDGQNLFHFCHGAPPRSGNTGTD